MDDLDGKAGGGFGADSHLELLVGRESRGGGGGGGRRQNALQKKHERCVMKRFKLQLESCYVEL